MLPVFQASASFDRVRVFASASSDQQPCPTVWGPVTVCAGSVPRKSRQFLATTTLSRLTWPRCFRQRPDTRNLRDDRSRFGECYAQPADRYGAGPWRGCSRSSIV